MDDNQIFAVIAVFIISLISLVGVIALSLNDALLKKGLFLLVSLAVGALFGDAFIHLIPHALEEMPGAGRVPFFVLLGIVIFFSLEKFLRWHHHHDLAEPLGGDHEVKPVGPLILIGDGLHNVLDGIIIGASFLISPEAGIATTIAIALHEIPQEIGDFGILLHSGYSKARALLFNLVSALFAFLGLGIVFVASDVEGLVPAMSAMAAGGFIYIAGSDLVPELQKNSNAGQSFQQLLAMLAGMSLMFALLIFEDQDHDHDHARQSSGYDVTWDLPVDRYGVSRRGSAPKASLLASD